jgi:alkanesulfonate monooxygenase SsuD/methylene tetrahydromethanopterin reductase-like flavin-dependent oxidoreductase (luciferase family)
MIPNLGFIASPADVRGKSDKDNYKTMLEEIECNLSLGYRTVWCLEHHVSEYSPTPSPLVLLSFVAGRYPDVDLGTSVLIAPWHQPVRLAGEIAMLATLSRGELHLGLGRGSAPREYDAFGVSMSESRDRFREVTEVLLRAFSSDPFDYHGQYVSIDREITIRPDISDGGAERIHLYGALASMDSAEIMARLHLGPIITTSGSIELTRAKLERWTETAIEEGIPTTGEKPLLTHCIIEDTDETAFEAARKWIPKFRESQAIHYSLSDVDYSKIKSYESHAGISAAMKDLTDPVKVTEWSQHQLIGSPETVAARLRQFDELGFTRFAIYDALPWVPAEHYRRWQTRLATEVVDLVRADRPQAAAATFGA